MNIMFITIFLPFTVILRSVNIGFVGFLVQARGLNADEGFDANLSSSRPIIGTWLDEGEDELLYRRVVCDRSINEPNTPTLVSSKQCSFLNNCNVLI